MRELIPSPCPEYPDTEEDRIKLQVENIKAGAL